MIVRTQRPSWLLLLTPLPPIIHLQIYFAERAYLEPTTMIGPSPDEIIPPVVLAFDPVDEPKRVVPEEAAAAAAVKSSASSAGRLRGPSSREEVKLREGR